MKSAENKTKECIQTRNDEPIYPILNRLKETNQNPGTKILNPWTQNPFPPFEPKSIQTHQAPTIRTKKKKNIEKIELWLQEPNTISKETEMRLRNLEMGQDRNPPTWDWAD